MNYANSRMDLDQVCEWLTNKGFKRIAHQMNTAFKYHTWTVDGMLRVDVISDCLNLFDPSGRMFKELQCDVTTHIQYTPAYEAHVD